MLLQTSGNLANCPALSNSRITELVVNCKLNQRWKLKLHTVSSKGLTAKQTCWPAERFANRKLTKNIDGFHRMIGLPERITKNELQQLLSLCQPLQPCTPTKKTQLQWRAKVFCSKMLNPFFKSSAQAKCNIQMIVFNKLY
jgi:hypothetical protein